MVSSRLIREAAFVGVTLGVILALVASLWPRNFRTASAAAIAGFVIGAALHLAYEALGLNRAYCQTGHACVRR